MENGIWEGREVEEGEGREVEEGEGRERKGEKGKEHERMMRVMEMRMGKKSYFHLL